MECSLDSNLLSFTEAASELGLNPYDGRRTVSELVKAWEIEPKPMGVRKGLDSADLAVLRRALNQPDGRRAS